MKISNTVANSNGNEKSSAPFDWFLRLLPYGSNVWVWLPNIGTAHAVWNLSSSSHSELNHFDNFDNWIGWNLCEIGIQFEDFVERAVCACVSSASCVRFVKMKKKRRDSDREEAHAGENAKSVWTSACKRKWECESEWGKCTHSCVYYLYTCICMCTNRDTRVSHW